MRFYNDFLPIGFVLLGQTSAVPTANTASSLLARAYTGYDKCSTDQTNKINRALQDAAVMARFHNTKRGSQTYRSSPAYTNYFQDDEDDTGVEAMLNNIGQQYQPPAPGSGQSGAGQPITLNQFTVHITCEDDPICSDSTGGTKSLVVTDISPKTNTFTPTMRFCPQFFATNEPRTAHNLDSLPYILNPRRGASSWCKTGEKFSYFEVAATTVLHELSHLNEAGNRAGLASHNDGQGGTTQGTEDIYGTKGYSRDPETAARQLHVNWNKVLKAKPTPPKDQWPPYVEKLNAESYAASVTEWWFMSKCNFDSILGN